MEISVVYAKGSTVARDEDAEYYASRIHNDIKEIRHGFIKLGFHLDEIKRCGYYQKLGYDDFYQFCEANYRLDKSTVSRYINVFYKFAEYDAISHTRKMWISEKYKDFTFSQLCEMVSVKNDKLLVKFSPDMTIKEMRILKKSGVEVATSQPETEQEECEVVEVVDVDSKIWNEAIDVFADRLQHVSFLDSQKIQEIANDVKK